MSYYKNQEFDFVSRTKEIIKQYDKLPIPKSEKYEVTLFLNCLVGLLILPQQFWFDRLPDDLVSQREWGIDENDISVIKNKKKKDESKTVKNIARHMRNSIAHYNFTVFSTSSDYINQIKIEDFTGKDKKEEDKTFALLFH